MGKGNIKTESRWRGYPLRDIRAYIERVNHWQRMPLAPGGESLKEVDPFAIVGGGKALFPSDLQKLLWGKAPFPRPAKWNRLLEAHRKNILLPPIVVLDTPEGMICRDGNHRLLLARVLGRKKIIARVMKVLDKKEQP